MSSKNHRRKRQRRLTIAVLPSMVTLLNLIAGFAAIHFTARGMNDPERLWLQKPELTFFAAAAYMIFLGMVADALDGRIARLSRNTSSFGGQLDSLADIVSFGVAPAFLSLRVVESSLQNIGPVSPVFGSLPGRLLWLGSVLYVCCAALRLARFNVENDDHEESAHLTFQGLPSPAAAAVLASLVLLHGDLVPELRDSGASKIATFFADVITYILPFITVGMGLLMVSRIRYPHIANQYVRGRKPFGSIVASVIIMLLLIWKLQLTLAIGSMTFAFSGAFQWAWHYQKNWRRQHTENVPEHTSQT